MSDPKPGANVAQEILSGVLRRIVFHQDDTGFTVLTVAPAGQPEVSCVGVIFGLVVGDALELSGNFEQHRTYGRQFRFDSFRPLEPQTAQGIEAYLASGLIPGVGPELAKRLVNRFGEHTLEVIEKTPERLSEVQGIGKKRKEQVITAFSAQRGLREVLVFLKTHAVTTGLGMRIYKRYGANAIHLVKEDPYRLALEINGVGFLTADRIAQSLGVELSSPRRALAGVLHQLQVASESGHTCVPETTLLADAQKLLGVEAPTVKEGLNAAEKSGRVVFEPGAGDRLVFAAELFRAECDCADRLAALCRHPAPIDPKLDTRQALEAFEARAKIRLAEGQKKAVLAALSSKVLVITGGPGTGKTTILLALLMVLERLKLRVALAAPTGRAAKRMQEATGHEAKTLHRLLMWNPDRGTFEHDPATPLPIDLLVIDESSMLDVFLFQATLLALADRTRVVLVGDIDQLPSVGPGAILADLINSGAAAVVRLEEIFRQAKRSTIVENAHRVQRGQQLLLPGPEEEPDFFFIPREEPEQVLEVIESLVLERIPRKFGLDPLAQIQTLTPMHKGLLGSTNLNALLQTWLNPRGQELLRGNRRFRTNDRVMQLRNNYDLDVFNGDLGRIVQIVPEKERLVVSFDGRPIHYELADLDQLTLAYACSIHKAQGSEFDAVILPIHTQHFVMLRRNLLYTAITRGKRLVVVVGSRRALELALADRRIEPRHTRLAERITRMLRKEV